MNVTEIHISKRSNRNKYLFTGVLLVAFLLNVAIIGFQYTEHQNFHSSISLEKTELKDVEVTSISSQVFIKFAETIKDVFVLKS